MLSQVPDEILGASVDQYPRLGVGTRTIRFFAWLLKAKCTHGSMVILRDESERVLLVRERLRERNRWGFPGGFMNISEGPLVAALREVKEECGLDIDAGRLQSVSEYRQPWAWHYEHVYTASIARSGAGHDVRSLEIKDARWFDLDSLPPLTRSASHALRFCRWG